MPSAFPDDPEDDKPISVTLIIVVVLALSVPVYESPFSNILDIGSLGYLKKLFNASFIEHKL